MNSSNADRTGYSTRENAGHDRFSQNGYNSTERMTQELITQLLQLFHSTNKSNKLTAPIASVMIALVLAVITLSFAPDVRGGITALKEVAAALTKIATELPALREAVTALKGVSGKPETPPVNPVSAPLQRQGPTEQTPTFASNGQYNGLQDDRCQCPCTKASTRRNGNIQPKPTGSSHRKDQTMASTEIGPQEPHNQKRCPAD